MIHSRFFLFQDRLRADEFFCSPLRAKASLRDMIELTNPQKRKLKALAQRLEPMLKVGKQGLSEAFLQSVNDALAHHELVKIKFGEFKEEKKQLAPQLAEKTASYLVMLVGNVVVLYRQSPDPERRKIAV